MSPHIPHPYTARKVDAMWRTGDGDGPPPGVAVCDCKWASENWDVAITQARELHCRFCGKLMDTTPLLGLEDGVWIDRASGKRFTVCMQDTTQSNETTSQPARSQVPRW